MLVALTATALAADPCQAVVDAWAPTRSRFATCSDDRPCEGVDGELSRIVEAGDIRETGSIGGIVYRAGAVGPSGAGRYWTVALEAQGELRGFRVTTQPWRHLSDFGIALQKQELLPAPLLRDMDRDGDVELVVWSFATWGEGTAAQTVPVWRAYRPRRSVWLEDRPATLAVARRLLEVYRAGPDPGRPDLPERPELIRGFEAVLGGVPCEGTGVQP